ncbi:tape measure protein [Arthrobacter phage Kepler]|uniref:Tape measure protein n=6 Tax=Coralvirus TaxID=2733171 RepID=A0A5J6TX03_9CAUD|nr:tail length tape measure protein [Arthrobacter phage Coral]YP_009815845.1 tail length tape measure protein [Arthrobacter phage Kepler]AYN57590.1 tape measure protein [Arthrobacter phage Cote]AYN58425.1 tape measure protein [Arthrobacter phage Lunar]AYN58567.1 tape measure protein [Arthrobacter phage Melons]QFG13072.1 tape measure protein [Arthrobacter phage Amelia]AYN57491.1 tape measure protein [Arthrobacter phage Coral]
MADAVELATAYVSLVPSMEGAQGTITKQLVPGAEGAASAAGAAAGGKFSKALVAGGAIGAGVGLAFKGLYDVGSTFDEVADTIRTGTGATGDALDGLVKSAENVGKNVPASFESVGTTVADLNTRLGLSGETLETVASQYLEAGRILGTEVDVAKTSAAFSAFGIEGAAVEGAMDSLFQASQATGVGMNELADAVSKNAPAMKTLGFSFEETAALAGSLDKAGLNSTQMMAAMSKGMVELAKDGEEPEAAFKRVTGEIQGFIDGGDKAAAIDLAGKVFGTRGAAQFVGALDSGKVALDDLVGGMNATNDTILGVGGETQDFAEKWQLVQNNAQAALEPLASAVFTGLGDALSGMLPLLTGLGVWLGENTWVLAAVAGVIGVSLVAAFIAWAASVWVATAALLANPMTWIVLGIVALIAGLVLLIANWDAVASFLSGVWAGVVDFAMGVWSGLASFFSGWISSVVSWFNSGISGLASWLSGIWRGISSTATGIWNALVGWVAGIPGRFMAGLAYLGRLAGVVGGWVNSARNAAVSGFNALVGWVGGLPGRILGALGNLGGLLLNAGGQIMQGFLNGLKNAWGAVTDFVGGIGQWIADNKGPKAYDLALLVPAGGWIMEGLGRGIRDSLPDLKRTLNGVSSTIATGVRGGSADLSASGFGLGRYDVAAAAGRGAVYVQNPWTGEYMLARVDERVGAGISDANADMSRRRVGVR